ncbi:type II secretion system protein [Thiomicrorhabdus lithotrophica]|uniref:Type II secretion system GspH family protein n=1 Tax=Thiomicrorhabdus lithotrophica TaxID=2949997 RepID=A0ABY8CCV0_9GAMM|nr:type II secretion system protein [Thiomicrorhabdus lithotrophica]WEJ62505.1 type II secretion system GspH family protein [Thiomicrorhabdus lithotrophica]
MIKSLVSFNKKYKHMGFSLIEAAIALVVIGVISMATLQVYNSANYYKNQTLANKWLLETQENLVQFAQMNYRLPCPDTDLDGYENCGGSVKTGLLPFYTLGLTVSSQIGSVTSGHQNIIYGVYRNAGIDADLTVLAERTGNSIGDANYQTIDDFKKALSNASLVTTVVNSQPYITGDDETTGAENCATNLVAHGAFWLASSSGQDANEDDNPFDGVNTNLRNDGSGSNCFSAPTKRQNAGYVDRVSGLAFSELLGLL